MRQIRKRRKKNKERKNLLSLFLSTDDYYYDYYNGIVVGEEEETRKEIHLCSSQKEKEEKEKKRIKNAGDRTPSKTADIYRLHLYWWSRPLLPRKIKRCGNYYLLLQLLLKNWPTSSMEDDADPKHVFSVVASPPPLPTQSLDTKDYY